MPEYAKTQAELAVALKVHRSTLVEWARDPRFPKKTSRGYHVGSAKQFAESRSLGPYRKCPGGGSRQIGASLVEARIAKLHEDTEAARIRKERLLVDQALEQGDIVLCSDVRKLYGETITVVVAADEGLLMEVDRAWPEETEPQLREKIFELIGKHRAETAAAMNNLA